MKRRFLCSILFFVSVSTFAANSTKNRLNTGALFKPDVSCSRSFIYRNRVYPLDSNRKQDGEGFRFLARTNPTSERLLNDYQSNRRLSVWTAYTGTLGAVTLILGNIYAGGIETNPGKRDTQYAVTFSGAFLLLGSYFLGQYGIRQNEKNLENAIEKYNQTVPDSDKVRVGLAPLPNEKGGAIKGTVNF